MSLNQDVRHLPLKARHEAHGGRMVAFAGYSMPIQYTSIKDEHEAVRQRVGLFDVSHMGEVDVRGRDAVALVDRIVTNDVTALEQGQALYTVMCHEDGGIVDDLLVYKRTQEHVFLCINAANRAKDMAHILKYATGDAQVEDVSDDYVQLALQGPKAQALLERLCDQNISSLKAFYAMEGVVASHKCFVSRTGYTGEDGFELYIPVEQGEAVFDALVTAGEPYGLALCGLGCRDTLRLEAKLHLYGQDITDETDPFEAGLSWTVKLDTPTDFVGKAALLERKARGVRRRLRGLVVESKGVIRQGHEIMVDGEVVGHVTSGSFSISLDKSIGLGYIELEHANREMVEVAVRSRRLEARVTKKAFYVRK